jgi:hypothetical protein
MPNFVQEPTKDDVLLGRGTGPNEYQGNIRFRALVKDTLRTNEFKKWSTGRTKTMLARMIVRDVKAQNGRFLKKVGKSSTGRDLFAVVPDRVAVDKTRQSFRHQLKSTENRKPKTPEGRGDQKYCLLDSASGSSDSSAKTNSMIPLPKAKGLSDATKEAEAKRIAALASGTARSSGLCSLLPQKFRITPGLVVPGSLPVPPHKHRSDALWGGGVPPSFGSRSARPTLIPLFDASIAQRTACFNQQRLPQLPFPSSLGDQGRLERRMSVSSPNNALDRLRFECAGTPEQAARDLAYLRVVMLSRAMTAHY